MICRPTLSHHGSNRPLYVFWIAILASGLLVAIPASAITRHDMNLPEERVIAACIHRAAHGHVWLEKTLWGLRDQEAGWIGAAIPNANGTYDLGPLQINSWWVPRLASLLDRSSGDVTHWLRNDACFNAEAARWIFLSGLASTGSFWKAIGAYHSPTSFRQRSYASAVAKHLGRRFGPDVFTPPSSRR